MASLSHLNRPEAVASYQFLRDYRIPRKLDRPAHSSEGEKAIDTMDVVQSLTNHCFRNKMEAAMVKPRRKAKRDETESESDPDSDSPSN